jgi:hypothetical protein
MSSSSTIAAFVKAAEPDRVVDGIPITPGWTEHGAQWVDRDLDLTWEGPGEPVMAHADGMPEKGKTAGTLELAVAHGKILVTKLLAEMAAEDA